MMGFAKSFKLAGILGFVDLESLRPSDANYDEIGGYQNPKGVIADYRNFDKDSQDGNNGNHDRDHASEVHLPPKVGSDNQPPLIIHRTAASVHRAVVVRGQGRRDRGAPVVRS
jgi:hypothetical protein